MKIFNVPSLQYPSVAGIIAKSALIRNIKMLKFYLQIFFVCNYIIFKRTRCSSAIGEQHPVPVSERGRSGTSLGLHLNQGLARCVPSGVTGACCRLSLSSSTLPRKDAGCSRRLQYHTYNISSSLQKKRNCLPSAKPE